jgi:hypothetical protein
MSASLHLRLFRLHLRLLQLHLRLLLIHLRLLPGDYIDYTLIGYIKQARLAKLSNGASGAFGTGSASGDNFI